MQKLANPSWTGAMQKTLILDRLAQLNLKNRFALRLKEEMAKLIEVDAFMPMRKGSIDLTWLAARIGATRQIFYARRGNPEVHILLAMLNEFLESSIATLPGGAPLNIENSRLQTELTLIKQENSTLKQQLRSARHVLNMIHAGGIVLSDRP
ncbi:hypothetical protein GIW37_22805 [Pseudomonas syringae]|nr:hypothetical protein [Pseudomonas syringae]MCF5714020.1 hypothetical protein [Pseudomonas tremae]MCF5210597.1 hypothetical protein [Pseudomonas syringae]MCF5212562.1 hypothetical protein [Pseudomonas syringae]MCF5220704.1 hypothetical protein [Pseudomonas syringae]